jgi:arginine N-succinyltransferase
LARSRYLFMKLHRPRFGDRTLAELRGVMDDAGNAPFWDALAGKFFDMSFPEADEFNAVHGTKFIADLMPRTPIYVALLDESAKGVIGQPHPTGRAALRMLEEEGFLYDRYVDIFDGGPTVTAQTDRIRTVRESVEETISEIAEGGRTKLLVATGRLKDFRACCASVKRLPRKGICIDRQAAELLGVDVGDRVVTVAR